MLLDASQFEQLTGGWRKLYDDLQAHLANPNGAAPLSGSSVSPQAGPPAQMSDRQS
jgi:hypothetical protein